MLSRDQGPQNSALQGSRLFTARKEADERKKREGDRWRRERSRVEWEMMGFLQDQQGLRGSEGANWFCRTRHQWTRTWKRGAVLENLGSDAEICWNLGKSKHALVIINLQEGPIHVISGLSLSCWPGVIFRLDPPGIVHECLIILNLCA